MSASGQMQVLVIAQYPLVESPLSVKADIQPETPNSVLANVRYTPQSRHCH